MAKRAKYCPAAIFPKRQLKYKEAAPHLILMAFLQNILNGEGTTIREYGSGRGRVDICLVHQKRHYPIELKIRYSDQTVEGRGQLAQYMDRFDCQEGWLVIFDRRPEAPWDEKIYHDTTDYQSKTIHLFGC